MVERSGDRRRERRKKAWRQTCVEFRCDVRLFYVRTFYLHTGAAGLTFGIDYLKSRSYALLQRFFHRFTSPTWSTFEKFYWCVPDCEMSAYVSSKRIAQLRRIFSSQKAWAYVARKLLYPYNIADEKSLFLGAKRFFAIGNVCLLIYLVVD